MCFVILWPRSLYILLVVLCWAGSHKVSYIQTLATQRLSSSALLARANLYGLYSIKKFLYEVGTIVINFLGYGNKM